MRKGVWRELFEDKRLYAELLDLERKSQEKVLRMLRGQSKLNEDEYGLGTERTLEEYQMYCGVDFTKMEITDDARFGGIEESKRLETFEEFQQNKLMEMISNFQAK